MMAQKIQLLDVVALMTDEPGQGLARGWVGTVVDLLGEEVFDVESSDDGGKTYVRMVLRAEQLPVLYYRPEKGA